MNTFEIVSTLTEYDEVQYTNHQIKIDGIAHSDYVDIIRLGHDLYLKGKHIPWYIEPHEYQTTRTCFYPWTCSCGNAGCAGIWESILCKHRKNTVEWRIPKNMGYSIDGFYSFDKKQYISEIVKAFDSSKHEYKEYKCDKILDYIKKYKEL